MTGFIPHFILAGTLACVAANTQMGYLWGAVIISVCNGIFILVLVSSEEFWRACRRSPYVLKVSFSPIEALNFESVYALLNKFIP